MNRYDVLLLIEANLSNPNGDPAMDNRPRTNPFTGEGLINSACLKRKIRDRIADTKEGRDGYEIYVERGTALSKTKEKNGNDVSKLLARYFDLRAFGGVLTKLGSVTGPVCFTTAKSIVPVDIIDLSITSVVSAVEKEDKKNQTMGTRSMVSHGLYQVIMSVSPQQAMKTGFGDEDFATLKKAVREIFHNDYSDGRQLRLTHAIALSQSSEGTKYFGNGLVERCISVKSNVAVPRSVGDYEVLLSLDSMPKGVTPEIWEWPEGFGGALLNAQPGIEQLMAA